MIRIERLAKSYGSKKVLADISVELFPGSIYGLAGSNGSGKTTLFECLRKIEDCQGSITLEKQAKVGYLPSSVYFYPNMKGVEYLEFCLSARKIKIRRTDVEEVNRLFELPLNEYAADYSTGMKKKLAFMALLMQKNDLLLLDEPFNGLDLSAVLLFKHILLKMKENNKTVFLSSHILSSLTEISDSIFYLQGGVIRKTYLKADFNCMEKEIANEFIGQGISLQHFLESPCGT
ncbi:Arginine transport ATP-binding protein ArtM [Bacteroidales bacterium Barb6XT]|nr:Arginine transport ATP-binding protein ArtM [Bacteroidales bacterium Barb6XT]